MCRKHSVKIKKVCKVCSSYFESVCNASKCCSSNCYRRKIKKLSRAYNKIRYSSRKEYLKAYVREWEKRNPGKANIYKEKNRIERYKALGSHTSEEWQARKVLYNYTCYKCWKKEPDIKLTKDHIVPLKLGGDNFIANIQPLCRPCNSSKSATYWVPSCPVKT